MATSTVTKDEVVGLIKNIGDRVTKLETPVQGLLQMAKQPASRAGVTPEEWLRGQFKDDIAVFDPHADSRSRRSRRITEVVKGFRSDNSPDNSLGHWCKAFHDYHDHKLLAPDARMQAAQVCKSFGTQRGSYKTVSGVDMVTKSDMLESEGSLGGFLVPTEFDNKLYRLEIEKSIVENYAQIHNMVSRTKIVAGWDQVNETFAAVSGQSNLLSGVRFYWAAEGATRQQTNPRVRNVVLNANELSFYCAASNVLLQDVAGMEAMLMNVFEDAVSWGVDWACFRGNGAGQPVGLQNSGNVINVSRQNPNQISIQDIENMYQYVYFPERNDDLVAVAHPSCIPWILRLNDQSGTTAGTGRRLFVPYNQGAQAAIPETDGPRGFGEIYGSKLLLSEKVPPLGTTGDFGFYNMRAYAVGRRMDTEIAVSTHVDFLQNSSVWRVVRRLDGQPLLGRKITYADAGTYASPTILLN